jgi:predicted negative regulator of RcsB-dependent stress response
VMIGGLVSSEKQLILIILVAVVVFGWQLWKDKKKKHDEKLQRHLSKYFNRK